MRAGAFIPLTKPLQSTSGYDNSQIELHYYFDKSLSETERSMYTDDGSDINAIKNGSNEQMEFEAIYKGSNLKFEFEHVLMSDYHENIYSKDKSIDFIIHNIQKEPKYIKVDGKKVEIKYNQKNKTLNIPIDWKALTEKEIKIKLKR